jgi:3-oxoacyl-[acyl-carrier protein] reductase
LRLAGKRAVVTGSSSGMGEAIAKFLAAEGVLVLRVDGGTIRSVN